MNKRIAHPKPGLSLVDRGYTLSVVESVEELDCDVLASGWWRIDSMKASSLLFQNRRLDLLKVCLALLSVPIGQRWRAHKLQSGWQDRVGMSFVPVGPIQGRNEEVSAPQRKRRAVPPSYGAQAFHAAPASDSNNSNASSELPPPPSRGAGSSSRLQGPLPTSQPDFDHTTPSPLSTGSSSTFFPSQLPDVPNPSARSPQDNLWSPTAAQNGFHPPAEPLGLPPPGSRRDTSSSGAPRTRRLATPTASFATAPSEPTIGLPTFQPAVQSPLPSFVPPSVSFYAETVEPVRSPPTVRSSTAAESPTTHFKPETIPSPAISPSMFSPVGRGANLFESSYSTGGSANRSPFAPTTTGDFFNADDDLPLFGAASQSQHITHDDSIHKTQATRVSGLFESTPSPSPPAIESAPALMTLHAPVLSDSASSLFEDDPTSEETLSFGAPVQQKQSPPTGSSVPSSSPKPLSMDSQAFSNHSLSLKPDLPVGASADLFSATEDDDLFLDSPIDISIIRSSQSTPKPTPTSQETPVKPSTGDSLTHGIDNSSITSPNQEPEVSFLSAPTSVTHVEMSSTTISPSLPSISAAEVPLEFGETPEMNTSPSFPSRSSPTFSTTPQDSEFKPAPPASTADSLFGEPEDGELDLDGFGSPKFGSSVLPPSVPSTATSIQPPVMTPPVHSPVQTSLGPQPILEQPKSTETVAADVSTTNPVASVVDFSSALVDINSSSLVESEPSLEETFVPNLDAPTQKPSEPASTAPSQTSFGGFAPSGRAPKVSGPKRPRHFQYTAGQQITPPTHTASLNGLDSSAPPPTRQLPPSFTAQTSVTPPAVASAPVSFVPVSAPLPGSTPPTVPPTAPIMSQDSFYDSHSTQSQSSEENSDEGSSKSSLLESFELVKSKGISWLRSKVGGSPSSASDVSSGNQEPPSHTDSLFDHQSDSHPVSSIHPPPSVQTPVLPPTIAVVGPSTKKQAKKTTKPVPAFKSAYTPLTAPAPLVSDSLSSSTTSSDAFPTKVEPLPANPSTLAFMSSGAQSPLFDDHPFHASSGLVSIDYSHPSPNGAVEEPVQKPSLANSDPFGSDDHVTATDLFSRLRDAIIPSSSSTSSSPSMSPSLDVHSSPSTAKGQEMTNSSSLSTPSQPLTTLTSLLDLPLDSTLISGTGSPLNSSTITIPLDSPAPQRSSRHAISTSSELLTTQVQLQSLQQKIKELTDDLVAAHQDRDRTVQQLSTLQATERDLRGQLAQLSNTADSVSLGNNAALQAHQAETRELRSKFEEQISLLTARAEKAESRVSDLEAHNKILQANAGDSARKLVELEAEKLNTSNIISSGQAELEARIQTLEKSLQDSRRSVSSIQALADSNESEAFSWKSKFETELAASRKASIDHDAVVSKMEEEHRAKIEELTRTLHHQQRLVAEAQSFNSSKSISAEWDQKQAEEAARVQQENERYIAVMQQQAASQTSVIDRLIHQNADLVKAVEFARRVLQEAKNPESLSGALADNDRLREELESAEKELAILRKRNGELESKSTHFEKECDELVRRLNSIDYRLLMQPASTASPAPAGTSSAPLSFSSQSVSSSSLEPAQQEPLKAEALVFSPAMNMAVVSSPVGQSPVTSGIPPSSTMVPSTPGDWHPKSPLWSPTIDSPVQSPSRLLSTAAPSASQSTTSPAISASPKFVVTAPIETHMPSAPGIEHEHMSPHIDLDELDGTVSTDLGEIDHSTSSQPMVPASPSQSGTPGRALRAAPQRGLFGRIWQAVTLQ